MRSVGEKGKKVLLFVQKWRDRRFPSRDGHLGQKEQEMVLTGLGAPLRVGAGTIWRGHEVKSSLCTG